MSLRIESVDTVDAELGAPPRLVCRISPEPDRKLADNQLCVELHAKWWYIGRARDTMSDVLVQDVLPDLVKSVNAHQELVDTVKNLLGAFDTPVRRVKMRSDFGDHVCRLARELLTKLEER